MKLVYWHRDGCGQPAFLYQEDALKEDTGLEPRYAFRINGDPILPQDKVLCDSCGAPLRLPIQMDYFRRERC